MIKEIIEIRDLDTNEIFKFNNTDNPEIFEGGVSLPHILKGIGYCSVRQGKRLLEDGAIKYWDNGWIKI